MKPGIFLLLSASFAAIASPAIAETQGTPGPTSTGTVTINASVTPEVNITNLDDFVFTATEMLTALNTGRSATKVDEICLWSNNVDGSLHVTASGDGAGGAFTLTDGTRTLPYNAIVILRTGATPSAPGSAINLVSGVKSTPLYSDAQQVDCGGSTNGQLRIVFLPASISTMEATTTYTGVLTLLVTPS